MSHHSDEYKVFEARLDTLLPEEYRDCYEEVQPVSMGSAGLKVIRKRTSMRGSACHRQITKGAPYHAHATRPSLAKLRLA